MGINCECGSVLKDQKGLQKHKKYVCKLVVREDVPLTHPCKDCDRAFASLQSLNLHRVQAHRIQYNKDMEDEVHARSRIKLWTMIEEEDLAKAEITLMPLNLPQLELNTRLGETIGRSADAVKKRRKMDRYLRILATTVLSPTQSKRSIPSTASPQPSTSTAASTSPVHSGRVTRSQANKQRPWFGPVQVPPTTDPPDGETIGEDSEQHNSSLVEMSTDHNNTLGGDQVREFLGELLQDDGYIPYADLITALLEGTDHIITLNELLSLVKKCASVGAPTTLKPKGKSRAYNTGPNCKEPGVTKPRINERAYAYKRWQELYKTNKKVLSDALLKGTNLDAPQAYPNIKDIEKEYSAIFGCPSPMDNDICEPVDYGSDRTYAPLSAEVISLILSSQRASAPGPDGITIADLRRVPCRLLVVLYNGMLLTGTIPQDLKNCRTTLIPKVGDLRLVSNWRPITVSSLIMRVFSRMLASRLNNIAINVAQKGFRPLDGCLTNTFLLTACFKEMRRRATPYTVATLDLRKAFDTVSIHSIPRALRRVGVDERVIRLVEGMYSGCTTTVKCGKDITSKIPITRGVKQGDPLSPAIFNLVMDELLCSIPDAYGLTVFDQKVPLVAYADDLLLMSPDERHAQRSVDAVVKFLGKRGLSVNHRKCTIMSLQRVPHKKKLFCATKTCVHVNNELIPTITVGDQFKYLGKNFDFRGEEQYNADGFKQSVNRVHQAPLKPHQKLLLLSKFIIPRAIWDMQYPGISAHTLKTCDAIIRSAAKQFLHLPKQTTSSFLYARPKDGGLGLTELCKSIPIILLRRIQNLSRTPDKFTTIIAESGYLKRLSERLRGMLHGISSSEMMHRLHRDDLEVSYSGNGLHQGGYDSLSSSWVYNPPIFWSGRDFVRAVQLRGNMLPTKGIPVVPKEQRACRAGCRRQETLSHVLQRCHATHISRIKRHDRIVTLIESSAKRAGYEVTRECRIRCSDGSYRQPDLVATKDGKLVVSDVAVCWEGPYGLQASYEGKFIYYSQQPFIDGLQKRFGPLDVTVAPYVIGARGILCRSNQKVTELFAISKGTRRETVWDVMRGSWSVHADFSRRVWRSRCNLPAAVF